METKMATGNTDLGAAQDLARPKRRRNANSVPLRYFLLKAGSSAARPELGQEVASEAEALIEAFRTGQSFYTVAAWKAVPEVSEGSPTIVKQCLSSKLT